MIYLLSIVLAIFVIIVYTVIFLVIKIRQLNKEVEELHKLLLYKVMPLI